MIPVIISVVLAVLLVALTSSGIRIYNECNEIKDKQKWKNTHMMLTNLLVVGIMIPVVLLAQFLSNGNITGAMLILYGLLGIIGSSASYTLANEAACASVVNASEKNFLMISVASSLFILLGGGAFLSFSRRE